jgi:Ca2+/Na+ antiporter
VRHLLARRLSLAAATAFLAINLWTGAPLFALWVGSQAVGQSTLSMGAVFLVVAVLATVVMAMVFALTWLDATYNRLTGHPLRENRLTWLRSMNTQGETVSEGIPTTALERIVMASVYIAVILFVVWFFLYARSPLPH